MIKRIICLTLACLVTFTGCGKNEKCELLENIRNADFEKIGEEIGGDMTEIIDDVTVYTTLDECNSRITYEPLGENKYIVRYYDLTDICNTVYDNTCARILAGDDTYAGTLDEKKKKIAEEEAEYYIKNNDFTSIEAVVEIGNYDDEDNLLKILDVAYGGMAINE